MNHTDDPSGQTTISDSDKPISERFRLAAKAWTEADAAARVMEEMKAATFSQYSMGHIREGKSVSAAQEQARASQGWRDYLEALVEARTIANQLKVEVDYLRMLHWEHQSHEASSRTERRM